MMMDWRHLEDPALEQLERCHLQDHRDGFYYKHAPNHHQKEFLLDHYRYRTNCPANGKRTHIAHEDLGWRRIEPQESETCTHQPGTKYRQFVHLIVVSEPQIFGKSLVPGDVRKRGQCRSGHHRY